jgi:hypothetical protein
MEGFSVPSHAHFFSVRIIVCKAQRNNAVHKTFQRAHRSHALILQPEMLFSASLPLEEMVHNEVFTDVMSTMSQKSSRYIPELA